MTTINVYDPFSDKASDTNFDVAPRRRAIVHGCEGALGIVWSAREAREAARRLVLMADEIEALPSMTRPAEVK